MLKKIISRKIRFAQEAYGFGLDRLDVGKKTKYVAGKAKEMMDLMRITFGYVRL